MRNLFGLSTSLLLAFSVFACASIESGDDAVDDETRGTGGSGSGSTSGSGGFTNLGSGGMGTGGVGSGGMGSGGLGSGGMGTGGMGTGGAAMSCTPGETAACADVFPEAPVGDAVCSNSGDSYDTSACTVCAEDDTRACQDPLTPAGIETCEGGEWVADCAACTVGHEIACEDLAIGATKPYGDAICVAGSPNNSYDTSLCTVCEGSMTLACAELPIGSTHPVGDATCVSGDWDDSDCMICEPDSTLACTTFTDRDYTGGTATCDETGNDYDKSDCEYCGNGVVENGEVCDGDDSIPGDFTCEDLGYTGDTDPITVCKADCSYNSSSCSLCDPGIVKCMGENAGLSCNASACTGAQCGTGQTCSFTASGWGDVLNNPSCNEGATCNIQCSGGNATCLTTCESGSSCNLVATQNAANPSGTLNCAAGSTCTWDFRGSQANISTGLTMNCEAGATCNVWTGNWQTRVSKVVCQGPDGGQPGAICNLNFAAPDAQNQIGYECQSGATCNCAPGSTGGNANICLAL